MSGGDRPRRTEPYTGLSASAYDLWFDAEPFDDTAFIQDAIAAGGEPALEVGCGTGRLLLDFVATGLDVEGVDASEEMLDICRAKAAARGLPLTLHRQPMQELNLPRRFGTIYVPFGSFMLVPEVAAAREALRRFHAHLEPGGCAIIPLHLPWLADVATEPAPEGEWCIRRQRVRPADHALVRCWQRAHFDFAAHREDLDLRFEVIVAGAVAEVEEHHQALRWYTQEEFADMLEAAGFDEIGIYRGHTLVPAGPDDGLFTFVAERSPAE